MALSKTTQDHEEIQKWAETRGAKPAEVAGTEQDGDTGIIRLEFPKATNANDANLKEISWEEFFEKFDKSGLALVYQELTADGEQSNFNKLVHPENVSPSAKTSAKKSATSARGGTAKKAAKSSSAKKPTKSSAGGRKSASVKSFGGKSGAQASPAKKSSKQPAKKQATAASKRTSISLKASRAKAAAKRPSAAKKAAKKTSKTASKRTRR